MTHNDDVVGDWTLDPKTRDSLRLQRAKDAYGRGELSAVMVVLEELLDGHPGNAEALALLADATMEAGDSIGATQIYDHVLTLVDANDSLLAALGMARFEACDLHGAISASREAVRLAADNADAHYTLGLALSWVDPRSQEAVRSFSAAHSLDPDNFAFPLHIEASEWERLVGTAASLLAEDLLSFWDNIPVRVETLPSLDELTASPLPLPPTVRGLYAGSPPGELDDDGARPEALRLFASNLARLGDEDRIIEAIAELFEAEALDWLGIPPEEDGAMFRGDEAS
ncbi:MAG: tetratricopeptide (TPR) repeat protein [Myxococcota bacterium]